MCRLHKTSFGHCGHKISKPSPCTFRPHEVSPHRIERPHSTMWMCEEYHETASEADELCPKCKKRIRKYHLQRERKHRLSRWCEVGSKFLFGWMFRDSVSHYGGRRGRRFGGQGDAEQRPICFLKCNHDKKRKRAK